MPKIDYTVSPTGGVIALDITLSPNLSNLTTEVALYRYANSLTSAATLLFSGAPAPLVWIDDGDNLPDYLSFSTPYYYQIIDPGGIYTTEAISPGTQLEVISGYLDKLLFRLFSAGLNALAVPENFDKIRVLQQMPMTMASEREFPFCVMNLDYESQSQLQLGQGVDSSTTNTDINSLIIERRYSLGIASLNAQERDFYKNSVEGIFYSIIPILRKIGSDIEISLQSAQTQTSDDNVKPGFYLSEIMLDITGQFNYTIVTTYPPISSIAVNISATTAVTSGIITSIMFNI